VIIVSSQVSEVLRAVRLMAETYGLALPGLIPKPLSREALIQLLTETPQIPVSKPASPWQAGKPGIGPEEIRRGIKANEFLCFFQPQITMRGAFIRGVEALVRWRHPEFGLLGPAAFLPQAEAEEELMSDLTMSILEHMSDSWHGWVRRGLHLEVSVNLSARSLSIAGFADRLLETTKRLGLPPRAIMFEVTESASVAHLGHCLANLARLRIWGFKLSIDDFGTGFATFEQLERMPFTELKIDQSITVMLPMETRQMSLANRMIQLAQDLKLDVVAEGIETLAAWRAIRELGCEIGQGYFIARPMPAERMLEWVKVDRSHLRA
jgi:EAL domain-containing protein (putative c-di-GMP-specific phosphodiesterase class I)